MVLRLLDTGAEAIEEVDGIDAIEAVQVRPELASPACRPLAVLQWQSQRPYRLRVQEYCSPAARSTFVLLTIDGPLPSSLPWLHAACSEGTKPAVPCMRGHPAAPNPACLHCSSRALQYGAAPPELQRMAAALVDKYYGQDAEE